MNLAKARRLLAACILPAAAVAALAGPGSASAFSPEPPLECKGENIGGQGSTFQNYAVSKVFIPDFKAFDCTGAEPTVTYNSDGSGAGLRSWGAEPKEPSEVSFGPLNAYVGTDNPPSEKQREEMEKKAEEPGEAEAGNEKAEGTVMTIPIEQASNAIIVHLPTGCTAKSKPSKRHNENRPVLTNAMLLKIEEGTAHWTELNGPGKSKIKCSGKAGKAAEKGLIKRTVRKDGSGTTAIQKKYMEVIMDSLGRGGEKVIGTETWAQNGQKSGNTEWPNEGTNPVIKGEGNPGVVAQTVANPGTVGYAVLANARAEGFGTPTSTTFWVELENGPGKYAEPSTDGENATVAKSNCAETPYTNGSKKFPPATVYLPWNEATTALEAPNYTLCGLTYELAMSKYKPYASTNAKEARTVYDFENYIQSTAAKGGQTEIDENTDYGQLPHEIRVIAAAGAKEISFE